MKIKGQASLWLMVGLLAVFSMALTTDQIWNAVYSSSDTALRTTLVSGGSSGTVSSVGLSIPGIFTITNSPVTTTGTLTATPAGTSGGIPYFSSATALASSGALTANVLVKGGGAGVAPAISSITDNGTTVTTTEALSVGALTYNGKLTISDIHADSGSFTVANRIHYITTGASAIAATMPASPATGDTYTIVKADNGAGTVVWTRAGSQTLNGATTRTISSQYKSDTCVYMALNVWICQGDAT